VSLRFRAPLMQPEKKAIPPKADIPPIITPKRFAIRL
jgi:hypothetical protein